MDVDYAHPFMISPDGCFQKDNITITMPHTSDHSNWFLEHGDDFTVLKRLPQSPDLYFGMWCNGRFTI